MCKNRKKYWVSVLSAILICASLTTPTMVNAQDMAVRQKILAQYQKAIQTSFREVRDALTAQTRARESFEAESQRVKALDETLRLARRRYEHGLASQLDVLDSERGLLTAEQARIDALRAQRAAIADLYKALGG